MHWAYNHEVQGTRQGFTPPTEHFNLLGNVKKYRCLAPLCGSVVKSPLANAGDMGSIPGLGRSPGEGNGHPLQYSCLENPMDRGAWQARVHRVVKSRTRLKQLRTNAGSCSTSILYLVSESWMSCSWSRDNKIYFTELLQELHEMKYAKHRERCLVNYRGSTNVSSCLFP